MDTLKGPGGAPLIGIVGWKKSGKTTVVSRLIEEFTRRGVRVSTIKHAHHSFQVDDGDTDSAKHRRSGAGQVAIVSSSRWAIVRELGDLPEPGLCEIVQKLDPCDLVIVEGYKSEPIPKIELRRTGAFDHEPLAAKDKHVIAIAADHEIAGADLPVLALDDIKGIADTIAKAVGPLGQHR
jgi:molybdopterin-guanine dinucleotide biosynthesis protein B